MNYALKNKSIYFVGMISSIMPEVTSDLDKALIFDSKERALNTLKMFSIFLKGFEVVEVPLG
jgi:hypothetical protein